MEDNSIIQPEDDYEGWCFIFLTALQPDGDSFTPLVPSYCRIINNIITTDKLPDPISDYTSIFLINFVPDALSKVLELCFVNQNEIDMINLFLISTSDLIPWAVSHEKIDLIKQIFPVICKNNNKISKSRSSNDVPKLDYQYFNRSFYSSHSKSYKTVIQHYVDVCIPLLIKQIEVSGSSFYAYNLIFYIISDINMLEIPINENIFKPPIESFLNFLGNLNVHDISDISELQRCVQNYTEFVLTYFQSLVPQLIQLSEEFIKSGILDKQFLGIETITTISESSSEDVKNSFSSWVSKTDLTDYILSKSFNNTFYERIRPIMVKLMSKELLEKFWNSALIAHRSQRKPMFEILAKAIVSIDEQSAIEFLNYVILSASSPHPSQVSLQSSSSSSVSSATNLTPLSSSESILSVMSSSDIFSSSSQNLIGSKLDLDIFQFLSNVACSFASSNQKMAENVVAAIFKLAILPANRKFSSECLISLCKVKTVQPCLFNLCCQQLSNFEIIEYICKILNVLVDNSYNLPFNRLKNAILRIVSQTETSISNSSSTNNVNNNNENNNNTNNVNNNTNNVNNNTNSVNNNNENNYSTNNVDNNNENNNNTNNNNDNTNNVNNNNENNANNNENNVINANNGLGVGKDALNRNIYQNNSLLDKLDDGEKNIQLNDGSNNLDPQQFQKYKILLCNLFYKILKKSRSPITKTVVDAFTKTGIDDSLFSMLLMSLKSLGVGSFGKDVNDILIDHITHDYNFEKASEIFSDFFVYFILKINIECNYIESNCKNPKEINLNPNKYTVLEIPLEQLSLLFKLFCEIENEKNLEFLMKQIHQIFTQSSVQTDAMIQYFVQLIDPYITEITKRSTYRALTLLKNLLSIEKYYYIEPLGYSRHIPTNFSNFYDLNIKIKRGNSGVKNISKFTLKALPITPIRIIQEQIGFQLAIMPKYIDLYKDSCYLTPGSTLTDLKIKNGDSITASVRQEYPLNFAFPSINLTNLHFQDKLIFIINNNDYENVTLLACEILNTLPDSSSLSSVTIEQIKNSQSGYSFLYKLQIYTKQAQKLDDKNNEFFLNLMPSDLNENEVNNPFNILSITESTSRTISCEALKFVNDHFDSEILCNSFDQIIMFCLKILCILNKDMSTYDDNQKNAISLLNKIIKIDSRVATELSLKNIDLIEKVMSLSYYDQENLLLLTDFFDKLDDLRPIFDICISHLNQQGSNDNFVKIFSHIVNKVVDFVNLEEVFTKCLESLNSNSNPHLFCEICKAIEALINTDSSFAQKYGEQLVTNLLTIAFENGNPSVNTSAFSISEKVCKYSKEAIETTIKILKPHFQKDYDFYSFKPSNNTRSHLNYTGLRNLGSTCYMNSIFQQLFYVPPFRYRIITEDFNQHDKTKVHNFVNDKNDDGSVAKDSFIDENIEAHNRFQYLFSEMMLTKRKACDTQPFCSVWKGWGKQLINPHEQQDAFEFLQIFIDQFPNSINKYFRGTVKNTIKGENFETSNLEQFYTICLAIQNCANITDAFKNFLQSETFPQYKTDDGRIIDAEKSARINEAPPLLVLQLKRFEYDYNTFERIKINDRCEFGLSLNIRDYMVNTDTDVVYQLTGAVLHAGTALGGHYTSVVNINHRWIYFNDQEVSIINNTEFQNMAFGGRSKTNDFDAEPCAFLLFYTKKNSEANGISFFEDIAREMDFRRYISKSEKDDQLLTDNLATLEMSDLIKPEIRRAIEKDNTEFIGIQCAFSQQMFSFVMTIDDPFLLITYFIDIFCHSGIDKGIKAQETIEASVNKLNEIQLREVFQYMVANTTKIDNILCQCTISDVTDSLTNVIYSCYKKLKPEETVEYIEHFFNVMISVAKNWRQIPQFAQIIFDFVVIDEEHSKMATERGWTEKLINYIGLIYEGQKSSVLINNIDLSYVFLSIQNLIENKKNGELIDQLKTVILQYTNQILSSTANLSSFIALVSLMSEKVNIDMSHFLVVLSSKDIEDSVFNDIFAKTIETVKTADQAKNLIRSLSSLKGPKIYARFVVTHIAKLIATRNDVIRQFFLDYPVETILTLVGDNEFSLRQSAEAICSVLFINSAKIPSDLKTFLPSNDQFGQSFDLPSEEKDKEKSVDDNDIHSEYQIKDEKAKSEMQRLFDFFRGYLVNTIIPNIGTYYPKENSTFNCINENSFRLVSFLKVFKWFILCLHNEDSELLSTLQSLLKSCLSTDYPVDYNMVYLVDIFALFDTSVANEMSSQLMNDMFRFIGDSQSYQVKSLFMHYWNIAEKASDQIFIELLKEPIFPIIIQHLLCNYTSDRIKLMEAVTDRLTQILSKENDQEAHNCVKKFILTVLNSELLSKMIDYSLEIIFPLMLIVSNDLQPELTLSILINVISLIIKESYGISFNSSRSKIMNKYEVMFFFVNYINEHRDFALSSLTIKYEQLIEFIVSCTGLCRSPYEHDLEKGLKKRGQSRIANRHVNDHFLHYSSLEYLSRMAKHFIGYKPTNTTENVIVSDSNQIESDEEQLGFYHAYKNDFLKKNEKGKKKDIHGKIEAPPIEEITMDFIFFMAFFNLKYPFFMKNVMKYFAENIQKKKEKKKITSMIQITRAWLFLCLHVTRIEIQAIENSKGDVKNAVDGCYQLFEENLNTIFNISRELPQIVQSAVFDFINSQVIELKFKLGVKEVKNFTLTENMTHDHRMLSFFIEFIKSHTSDFMVESVTSPSTAEFYGIGLTALDDDSLVTVFDVIAESFIGAQNDNDTKEKTFLQKLWFILRKRPDMHSILKEIFETYNFNEDGTQIVTRENLESLSMNGFANLIFGKIKKDETDNGEEEEIERDNDDDIFENYKNNNNNSNESDEEYDDFSRQTYNFSRNFGADDDDDSEDDEPDVDRSERTTIMGNLGLDDNDITRSN